VNLLQEACTKAPKDLTLACNFCLLLADLGRWEEARVQLQRAETLVKVPILPMANQRRLEAAVQECRDRLGGKSKSAESEGMDES
jgi:hypothetical protein